MTIDHSLLNNVKSHKDILEYDKSQIKALTDELRSFLIKNVSENGGHLASNLGTVELTIALLRSFDPNNDKIIWDVGHQSYTYKILTRRAKEFNTIRKRNGLSGYPKREESSSDHFNTGHSSTSISAALGYARASKLKGEESNSVAVIGDGALTGGMALEAMNDAGASGDNIIIILNDNEMSISKNVGGIAEYFSRMRSNRLYSGTNLKVKSKVEKIPIIGKLITRSVHNFKSAVKYLFSQGMLFEEMGLKYMGPVNGHDVRKLENIFNDAKKVKGPVLVHVVTKKGKGLSEAEKEPQKYHGISGNGHISNNSGCNTTFSESFGKYVVKLAEEFPEISVICPAVAPGCGLVSFSLKYSNRFFDVGIAEQHAVTLAAGMACNGITPIVSSYATFMQRAYDQILHDVCLMKLHVIFTMDRAGLVGYDGETHQGIYDLAFLSHMPGIKVFSPYNSKSLDCILRKSINKEAGPVVIRYPKGPSCSPFAEEETISDGLIISGSGNALLIISYGRMLVKTYSALKTQLDCKDWSIVGLEQLVPLEIGKLDKLCSKYKKILFIEDVVFNGSCVQRFISKTNIEKNISIEYITVPDSFNSSGSLDEILNGIGMGNNGIIEKVKGLINK